MLSLPPSLGRVVSALVISNGWFGYVELAKIGENRRAVGILNPMIRVIKIKACLYRGGEWKATCEQCTAAEGRTSYTNVSIIRVELESTYNRGLYKSKIKQLRSQLVAFSVFVLV